MSAGETVVDRSTASIARGMPPCALLVAIDELSASSATAAATREGVGS